MKFPFRYWLKAPVFPNDKDKTQRASLLNAVSLIGIVYLGFITPILFLDHSVHPALIALTLIFLGINLLLRVFLLRGSLEFVGIMTVILVFTWITMACADQGTILTPTAAMYIYVVILAGALFRWVGTSLSVIASSLAVLGLILAENAGLLPQADFRSLVGLTPSTLHWFMYTALFVISGGLSLYTSQSLRRSLAQARTDIAERERAELKLRSLFEQTHDAVFLLDLQGRHIAANRRSAEMLGYTVDEILKLSIKDLSAEIALSQDVMDRLLSGVNVPPYERQFRKKNGEIIPVEINVETVCDEAGNFLHIQSVVRDITERKRAEAALRESQANFNTFFETITDMVIVGTLDGRILFANSAVSNTLGYAPEELARMHVLDLNPTEQRSQAEEIFAAMFRGERNYCPLPLQHKNGTLIPAETRVWFGRWNQQDCIFGIMKDLTADREAQQRFEALFHDNPAPMALTTVPDRRYFDVNQAFLSSTGYTRAEVIDKTAAELDLFVHPEEAREAAEKLLTGEPILNNEIQVRVKDGTVRDGLFWGEMIRSQGREYFLTLMIDITEQKKAEGKLRESEETYRALFEVTNDGILLYDLDSYTILRANPRCAQIIGYASPAELIGRSIFEFMPPGQAEDARSRLGQLLAGQPVPPYERTLYKKDGSLVETELNLSLIRDPSGQPLYVQSVVRDITRRRQAEEALQKANLELRRHVEEIENLQAELREQALHDPLTGLFNRRYLGEALEREILWAQRSQAPLSVIVSDIDHFKDINDAYGHKVGDEFLIQIAALFKRTTRGTDFVCRYGGEEFLLVLPGAAPEVACQRAEEIRQKCEDLAIRHAGRDLSVTLSFGVAAYPLHGQGADDIITKADHALYSSKAAGRNRVTVWEEA